MFDAATIKAHLLAFAALGLPAPSPVQPVLFHASPLSALALLSQPTALLNFALAKLCWLKWIFLDVLLVVDRSGTYCKSVSYSTVSTVLYSMRRVGNSVHSLYST